jgi:hypothetical protein
MADTSKSQGLLSKNSVEIDTQTFGLQLLEKHLNSICLKVNMMEKIDW